MDQESTKLVEPAAAAAESYYGQTICSTFAEIISHLPFVFAVFCFISNYWVFIDYYQFKVGYSWISDAVWRVVLFAEQACRRRLMWPPGLEGKGWRLGGGGWPGAHGQPAGDLTLKSSFSFHHAEQTGLNSQVPPGLTRGLELQIVITLKTLANEFLTQRAAGCVLHRLDSHAAV